MTRREDLMRSVRQCNNSLSATAEVDASGRLAIRCRYCDRLRFVLDGMYRCFDCGAWICLYCVPGHFGNQHEPHPLHLHEYESAIEKLKGEQQ